MLKTLANPFALTPGFTGPAQPSGEAVEHDAAAGQWAAPFIMATINTKNVHRTNFLLGQAWGADFVYDEMMLTGDGAAGEKRAKAAQAAGRHPERRCWALRRRGRCCASSRCRSRARVRRRKSARRASTTCCSSARRRMGGRCAASVKGDKDPGYGSTSKMISRERAVPCARCRARRDGRRRVDAGRCAGRAS